MRGSNVSKLTSPGSVSDPLRSVSNFVVLTAEPDDPVVLLARRMKLFDCGALLVESEEGYPAIVSERDLLRAIADGNTHLVAKDLATDDPIAIHADAQIGDAAAMMIVAGIRHLVVEDGERYGIVSMRDLLEPVLASALE